MNFVSSTSYDGNYQWSVSMLVVDQSFPSMVLDQYGFLGSVEMKNIQKDKMWLNINKDHTFVKVYLLHSNCCVICPCGLYIDVYRIYDIH